MKKLWNEFLDGQPKAQANWDRTAKAPPKSIIKEPVKTRQRKPTQI